MRKVGGLDVSDLVIGSFSASGKTHLHIVIARLDFTGTLKSEHSLPVLALLRAYPAQLDIPVRISAIKRSRSPQKLLGSGPVFRLDAILRVQSQFISVAGRSAMALDVVLVKMTNKAN